MKYIHDTQEYKQALLSSQCIMIYSSTRTCQPCRELKKFIDKEYPTLDNVYYIDIDVRKVKPLFDNISAEAIKTEDETLDT